MNNVPYKTESSQLTLIIGWSGIYVILLLLSPSHKLLTITDKTLYLASWLSRLARLVVLVPRAAKFFFHYQVSLDASIPEAVG